MSDVPPRVALVSGGGRGIGRAIARALAAHGAAVGVAARTPAEIEEVAQECRTMGSPAAALPLDVTDAEACREAVVRCERALGPIDVLVNNAGIVLARRFPDLDGDAWQRMLAVNLTGAFNLTQAALPGMLARGAGTVLGIGSLAGRTGAKYYTAYGASKHGLIGLMRSLAVEYARSGVTFNCVCPAYTDTAAAQDAIQQIADQSGRDRSAVARTALTPQGRLVEPEEVAAVCVFLAGPGGRGINGQAINVDGGQVPS